MAAITMFLNSQKPPPANLAVCWVPSVNPNILCLHWVRTMSKCHHQRDACQSFHNESIERLEMSGKNESSFPSVFLSTVPFRCIIRILHAKWLGWN